MAITNVNVDARKFLEQAALPRHHRLAGERPDIAEPEHGRAVGDDRDQIGAPQLKREWSLWPEFGSIPQICATLQRDNLRRHF
jgi:hypothetical protein